MQKLKEFLKTKVGQQIYSFIKTYVTVFLGIYLTLSSIMSEPNFSTLQDLNIVDINILTISAKGAFISVIRNIYKLLTE